MDKIKIIVGATAVGKTSWSIDYAKNNNAEIISADSMQIYKYMDIGTAKPTEDEKQGIPHHMMDMIYPDQEFSVYNFARSANELIKHIRSRDKEPIIVGGTGLYVNAFIRNFLFPQVPSNEEIRNKLKQKAKDIGTETLYKELSEVDPDSLNKITPNDTYRIVRALEVYYITGKPLSSFHQKEKEYRKDIDIIWLDRERPVIYERIEKRVDKMIEDGLFEEVKSLLDKGYAPNLPSMKALGYKESIDYINSIISKDECIEIIKKKTRNFAKRQITWFRSFPVNNRIEL